MARRCVAVVLIALLLCALSGCSFVNLDMEKQLRAPHAAGEQSEIQTALEQHIYARNAELEQGAAVSYVLKYPRMGDHRSAFIMKDMNGDGKDEALAFYALQPEGANSHIALLRKIDGVWTCTDDIEGLATEVERIHFGDLDGNGSAEVFAGFSMYNTRDRRLMIYSWEDDRLTERYSDTYSHMLVGNMTSLSHDDLLLFRLNSAEKNTSVKLLCLEEDEIVSKGEAALDGYIVQFQNHTFAQLDDEVRGVYQDCVKDSRTTITELILWDGKTLTAPLYNVAENITTHSARESDLHCKDIDGDKQLEWPTSKRLPGDENTPVEEVTIWQTDWYSWDAFARCVEKKLSGIVNPYDGYQIVLPEEWDGVVTAQYDVLKRCLTVVSALDGEELFRVVAFSVQGSNPYGNDFVYLGMAGQNRYELKVAAENSFELTSETVSSLFMMFENV